MTDYNNTEEDEMDSDYSLDYEYLGPRRPNYRPEDDNDSVASELSCESIHDSFDMWDEDPHSTNDFTWESNDMKLTSFIKLKQRELRDKWKSFWRKEKGWPRQLPYSNSTTNHDQSANSLSLVLSDFGSKERLHAIYKDRIIECGQYQTSPATITSPNNNTTWLDHDVNPIQSTFSSTKFIETHASISQTNIKSIPPTVNINNACTKLSSKFTPYTKYLKRSEFPITQHAFLSLHFEPMCLTEKYGYMAIGGIEGEFELYCCMEEKPVKIWGTKFKGKNNVLLMTNSIQIIRFLHKDQYQFYLIACMNDAGILVFRLPNHDSCQKQVCQLQSHIRHFGRVPINDARVSPDGLHLICVGDEACIFYLSISFNPNNQQILLSSPKRINIPMHVFDFDKPILYSSQYVAWSKSSLYFAHTSDSHHLVFVWRTQPKLELIHQIDAGGYTYAIQFHPEIEDVFSFSNRYGYFHTVRLNENLRHEITMVSFRGEKNRRLRILAKINGLQWSKDGCHLYVATKKRVLAYEFLMSSCHVQSLERMAGQTALSILDKKRHLDDQVPVCKSHGCKKKKLQQDWLEGWDNIPLHIKHHVITDTHLASHW